MDSQSATLALAAACACLVVVVVGYQMKRSRPRRRLLTLPPSSQVASPPPLVGQTLTTDGGASVYIEDAFGQGGMAEVYRGRLADGPVAVKVMRAQPDLGEEAIQRFRREVAVCRALHHPGIVKVLDVGVVDSRGSGEPDTVNLSALRRGQGKPFMVMELVDGHTLGDILRRQGGPLPSHQVVPWLREALEALREAHQAGIIHRDLKPENLMLSVAGKLRIMDFGLARVLSSEALTRSNSTLGTPQYMSPEHLNAKEVVPASDIYSLGVTAYELLSGRCPVDGGDAVSTIFKMMTEPITPLGERNPDVPGPLGELVMSMMERDLSLRPASCDDVLNRLP